MPAASSLPATTSNRSGLRGTSIRKTPRIRRHAAITASSSSTRSSAIVLAAIHTFAGRARSISCTTGDPASAARGAKSYFKFPPTVTRSRAQREEAPPHLLRLRQNRVHRGQHHRKHPPQPQVLGQRLVRNSPVDHRQARACPMHLAEQIRPDLRLRHHYQRRLQRAKYAPHREHIVHRREEDSVGSPLKFLLRRGASRQRRRGNEQPGVRKLRPQSPRELHARQNLAHRNCMQPDRSRTNLSKRMGKKSEPLRQAAPVTAVPHAAPDEIQ